MPVSAVRFRRLAPVALATLTLVGGSTALGVARVQDDDAEYAAEMKKAETAMTRRQYDEALKAFKRASSVRNKSSADAHLGMARAYHGLGAFKSAVDSCEDAAKHWGEDATLQSRIHNQRGVSLFASAKKPGDKQLREAEAAFRSALALNDTLIIARYNLGVALLRQGRDPEGVQELNTFISSAGRAPEVAEATRMIENPRRARESFAPDFSITTLDERHLTLEDLKGKVVLLDFWATWCGPCVMATPGLVQLHKKYKDRPFMIVGVSLDNSESPWRNYIEQNKMEWPQYYDRNRRIAQLFNVRPIPTYILLDHEGIVKETRSGWSPSIDGWLDGQIRKYLKAIPELPHEPFPTAEEKHLKKARGPY